MQDHTPDHPRPLSSGEKPTLRTLARLSGLAVTTVSRALGDAPDISAETKARLRTLAREIGYVPNRAGVRLRTGRTNVISLVLGTEHDGINMTTQLIASIAEGLRGTPFHLVMTPSFPDEDPLKAIRYIVETRSADAVIINQTEAEDARVAYLRAVDFPFVTHGRTVWAENHPWVDYDNEAFGRIAVAALAERGRRRILMLAPPRHQFYAAEMIRGAQAAAVQAGVRLEWLEDSSSDSDRESLMVGIGRILDGTGDIDALVAASPNAAMAAIATLEARGRRIGVDFDVCAKETVRILSLFRPGILTVAEDVALAGRRLAKAAVQAALRLPGPPVQAIETPAACPAASAAALGADPAPAAL